MNDIIMVPSATKANLRAICAEVQRLTGSPDSILYYSSRPGDGVAYVFDNKVCSSIRQAVYYAYGRLEETLAEKESEQVCVHCGSPTPTVTGEKTMSAENAPSIPQESDEQEQPTLCEVCWEYYTGDDCQVCEENYYCADCANGIH